jgi:signal peptidase I
VTASNRPIVFAALAGMAAEAPIELAVRGTSMAPHLREGDRVQISRATRYRAGEILVFRNSVGDLVARFVLRGDAAPAADGLVPPAAILGRVVGGDVPRRLVEVPWHDRWRARWRFLAYAFSRLLS